MKLIDIDNITDDDIYFALGPECTSQFPDVLQNIKDMLNDQPEAFNIDNVIKEIKEESFEIENDLIPGMSFEAVFTDVVVDIINDRGIEKNTENKYL